jgi:hypothetical protein
MFVPGMLSRHLSDSQPGRFVLALSWLAICRGFSAPPRRSRPARSVRVAWRQRARSVFFARSSLWSRYGLYMVCGLFRPPTTPLCWLFPAAFCILAAALDIDKSAPERFHLISGAASQREVQALSALSGDSKIRRCSRREMAKRARRMLKSHRGPLLPAVFSISIGPVSNLSLSYDTATKCD